MVRENRVFCTSDQKFSSEDILRALRVSSFFRLSGAYVLMDIRHDLPGKGRGDSLKNSISCAYGVPFSTCSGEYTYVNTSDGFQEYYIELSENFQRDISENFLIAFARMCRLFCFCLYS